MINSSYISFENFKNSSPDWETNFKVYQRDSSIYKRIVCSSKEGDYHACLNIQNGDLYVDCRRRKIYLKHFLLLFARPIHTAIKTLWHASIVGPLSIEIFKVFKGQQKTSHLLHNTFASFKDILRTPIYGLAMTLVHLAALVFGAIKPNTLYKTREIAGMLERKMLRDDSKTNFRNDLWALSDCFSPYRNLLKDGPDYRNIRFNLSDYGEKAIKFRKEFRKLFNDGCKVFPKDKKYVSAAAVSQFIPS